MGWFPSHPLLLEQSSLRRKFGRKVGCSAGMPQRRKEGKKERLAHNDVGVKTLTPRTPEPIPEIRPSQGTDTISERHLRNPFRLLAGLGFRSDAFFGACFVVGSETDIACTAEDVAAEG